VAVRLFALTCGWLTGDLGLFVAGESGRIRVPVPCYLVEHPRGRLLFDSGLHPQAVSDPGARLGPVAHVFEVDRGESVDVGRRLEEIDVDPGRIDWLVNSHLHFDHAGGNACVPNARLLVQRPEWEAGQTPELVRSNGYQPDDYDTGHDVLLADGEHDVFGDGSVMCMPTYGHTPGHQSLRVRLASGDVVLTGDACYLRRTLEEQRLPAIVHDPGAMRESLRRLAALQSAGARIFFGHDPDFWQSVPQAPLEIV